MSTLQTAVLDRPPSYLGLLPYTVWENEQDPIVRESKRANSFSLNEEINKFVEAENRKMAYMYGALYARVFIPKPGVAPLKVRNLSMQLARIYDGVWNQQCRQAMAPYAVTRDFGLVCLRVVTTVGVNFIVDGFQGTQNISTLRYHGVGTGTNSEVVGDTALQTELTTQLTPASTRATGTLTEGASANIFRTVGSNVVNTSVTATEHGIFNQAATGGGTLLDRSVFSGIGLVNGNTLQTTYDLTLAAGG